MQHSRLGANTMWGIVAENQIALTLLHISSEDHNNATPLKTVHIIDPDRSRQLLLLKDQDEEKFKLVLNTLAKYLRFGPLYLQHLLNVYGQGTAHDVETVEADMDLLLRQLASRLRSMASQAINTPTVEPSRDEVTAVFSKLLGME